MKRVITFTSLILTACIAIPSTAQVIENQAAEDDTACVATTPAAQLAINAAKNEARQMAESTNGGLSVYRAEAAMHGSSVDSPCEKLSTNTWRFTIRGGEPTAVALEENYTLLSVVTVNGTGRDRTVTMEYNGPIEAYVQ